MKKIRTVLALAFACMTLSVAHAGVSCSENVTNVIVHSNGNIYFQTDKTCASWCQISFATDSANKNAYAMLLTARTTAKPLNFAWPNITACTASNAVYASPEYIYFNS